MTKSTTLLSRLLISGTEPLDITQTQYERAVNHYTTIGKWLLEPGTLLADFNPRIFPQGSFVLGTTVKPLRYDEFDIDLVCLADFPDSWTPEYVKKIVGIRLAEHDTYKGQLEEKNRCWRLNYAGQFHLDIISAKPNLSCNKGSILVPDKELKCWMDTNPKGFIKWFSLRKRLADHKNREALVTKASVEPCPEYQTVAEKLPLQIANQIMKRHRDIKYKKTPKLAPISMIITTLSSKAYNGETEVLETLEGIAYRMEQHINYYNKVPWIPNPTNINENFADKWLKHPERQKAFHKWVAKLRQDIEAFKSEKGIHAIKQPLSNILGGTNANRAIEKYQKEVSQLRHSDMLHIGAGTGIIGGLGPLIKRNTFYGD